MLGRLLSLSAVTAIAHRGGAKLRPENTLAALDHAVTLGVDAVECDVQLSRDGEPVVIHDDTLDRTTNATGRVDDHTASGLERLDAAFHFRQGETYPFRRRGYGVPRLADLLARHPAMTFIVEIKGNESDRAARVLAVIARAGAEDRVIIGSYSQRVLDAVRRLAPDIPTSASELELRAAVRRARFWLPPRPAGFRLLQAPRDHGGRPVFRRSLVTAIRRASLPLQVWVVDDEAEMRALIDWGVTGIISDRPDVAVRVVREAGRR